MSYPSHWPNSHYYKRYCRTYFGLAVVTDSLASDAALERTAWTLDMMMQVIGLVCSSTCVLDDGLLRGGLDEGGGVQAGCDGALPK